MILRDFDIHIKKNTLFLFGEASAKEICISTAPYLQTKDTQSALPTFISITDSGPGPRLPTCRKRKRHPFPNTEKKTIKNSKADVYFQIRKQTQKKKLGAELSPKLSQLSQGSP